jgi:hypothetical protein
MKFVKVAKFARLNPDGQLERLQCKLCGTVIGEVQERTIGTRQRTNGRMVERVIETFTRNHLYTEVKIVYDDGSAHITNGCSRCLTGDLNEEQMDELTYTDEDDLGLKRSGRKPLAVVKALIGGGIV